MRISFVMRLQSSFPNMLHNQLVYSFYSDGKLTIRMIHVHIVIKSDTQARYVKFSSQFSVLLFPQNSDTSIHIDYRQITHSFLSSPFPISLSSPSATPPSPPSQPLSIILLGIRLRMMLHTALRQCVCAHCACG